LKRSIAVMGWFGLGRGLEIRPKTQTKLLFMRNNRDLSIGKFHDDRKTKVAMVLFVLLLLPAFSIMWQPTSFVSAEPDEFVNSGSMTVYHCETEGDVVSYNATLKGQKILVSWLHSFDSKLVEDPKLSFTTDLPVSDIGGPYPPVSLDPTYQWVFPDVEPGEEVHADVTFDPNLVPASFTPDFSASRTITPNKLEYPGGTQTIILSVTPQKPEFAGVARGIVLRVSLLEARLEDNNFTSSVVSVTWPTVGETESLTPGQTEKQVQCAIGNPRIGVTYTLVVVMSIELKEGIRTVEYKPLCEVRDDISVAQYQNFYGKGNQTFVTESGTWKWNTTSEHNWLIAGADNIQENVYFLPSSQLTLGYKLRIHNLPPGADFETWVDKGGIFSSDDIPVSFVRENATIYYYATGKTRYRFIGWSGDYDSSSFDLNIRVYNSTVINTNWGKECEVTIQLSMDSSLVEEKQEWYAEHETLQHEAPQRMTKDFFFDYVLDHYTINNVIHREREISVNITEPTDAIAYYRSEINIVNISIGVLVPIAAASILIFLGMRKRKSVARGPEQSA